MTSKSPVRSCDDLDEATLSYAEIKALCAGNPQIKEKMELDVAVAKLKLLKSEYQNQHYRLEDELLRGYPEKIASAKNNIVGFERDMELLKNETRPNKDGFSPMEINGGVYREKAEAGAALLAACKNITTTDAVKIGSYRGFDMSLWFSSIDKTYHVSFQKDNMSYRTDLGTDTFGNITRINNTLGDMESRLNSAKSHLGNLYRQQEEAANEVKLPFQFERELAEKSERLVLLDAELNMNDGGQDNVVMDDDDDEYSETADEIEEAAEAAKSTKPSLLGELRANIEKIKRSETYTKERSADALAIGG